MSNPVQPIQVKRSSSSGFEEAADLVAVEEPMEIRIGFGESEREQRSLSVTMRTPGNDFELAIGFLFTENIIRYSTDIASIAHCSDAGRNEKENIVRVELARHVKIDWLQIQRNFYTTSSCGVCGKASIDAVQRNQKVHIDSKWSVKSKLLQSLPGRLRASQLAFAYTGGLHGIGVFDVEGNLILLREDVGRHNALDKVVGALVMQNQIPAGNKLVLFSGRASFELVQKAVVAGFPLLASIGAPSSLAISLARESGATLIGFLNERGFNTYCGHERVTE